MKKHALVLGVGVILVAAFSQARATDLSVESITVNPPGADCKYEWQARIKNNGTTDITENIAVQGLQGDGAGYWGGATGTTLGTLVAGDEKTITGRWLRKPGMTQLKVVLRQGGQDLTEMTVALEPDPPVAVEIADFNVAAASYTTTVKNNNAVPVTELTVQGYKATADAPDTWVPCGGGMIIAIPGNGTGSYTSNTQTEGYELYKIQLRHGTNIHQEKIFDLRPAPAEETPEETPTTVEQPTRMIREKPTLPGKEKIKLER